MVGSGYRSSSGSVAYESVYRGMINDELARAPQAAVTAYWRRVGNTMRFYTEVTNTGDRNLREDQEAAIWVIVWENSHIGVSETWVWRTVRQTLTGVLRPGESVSEVINTPVLIGVNWNRLAGLALVENRPGGTGRYDMLQAAEAVPASFNALPDRLTLNLRQPAAEVVLEGPHVLSWTASADVEWLRATPASGTGRSAVTVFLVPGTVAPANANTGSITFEAVGDGMAFTETVEVTVGMPVRRPLGRVIPD